MRDLRQYVAQFQTLPFEPIQASYRRKLVLREVARANPKRVLEIGCGMLPLFTALPIGVHTTVIEPADEFVNNARVLAKGRDDVTIVQSFVEDFSPQQTDFDVIVLSCVLHETSDPKAMLAAIHRLCSPGTMLHVNVPNAESLHRQLAVAMGIIQSADAPSATQRTMQQRLTVYDRFSLAAELNGAGFDVLVQGGMFVKPFTHGQMQQLVDCGFLTPDLMNGLDRLAEQMPNLSSEIWVNARRMP